MAKGDIPKDFDVVNKDAPEGINYLENPGVQPRSGPAKMDGGTNDYKPFDTGNYKGKKGGSTLFSPDM